MIFQHIFRKVTIALICGLILTGISSCKKYLDKKPLITAAVPSTLNDLQALLDNQVMNDQAPSLPEVLADNYFVTSAQFASISGNAVTPLYLWNGETEDPNSWSGCYLKPVYYANVVLDYLPLVRKENGEDERERNLKGAALFHRGFAFFQLSQVFCKPYSSTSNIDPGIILKMTSNINEVVTRATVQQTYDRILTDLKEAVDLLPSTVSIPTRPSKTAAYAALARVYLSMRDYTNAGLYANLALQQYNTLIDYNTLIPVGAPPVRTFNPEVIFHSFVGGIPPLIAGGSLTKIDSNLYASYDLKDLRKTVFFQANTGIHAGTYRFSGSYHGSLNISRTFDGLTTDELYLIRAESYAKNGNTSAALADLNTLMVKRWANGLFTDITAANADEALQKIRAERRKELIFRGQRWTDLRRYNLEDSSITLTRIMDGVTYTLPPNDKRWVMLIPSGELFLSGIQQNPR